MKKKKAIKKPKAKGGKMVYKKRILIIDDEKGITDLEKEILEGEGFEVNVANDGVEGLKKIKGNVYDVIISDFEMPHMKGDELYMEVKNLSPQLEKRIIFVSGIINDFIKSTGNRFLAKPFSLDQFIEVVKEVIEFDNQIS